MAVQPHCTFPPRWNSKRSRRLIRTNNLQDPWHASLHHSPICRIEHCSLRGENRLAMLPPWTQSGQRKGHTSWQKVSHNVARSAQTCMGFSSSPMQERDELVSACSRIKASREIHAIKIGGRCGKGCSRA